MSFPIQRKDIKTSLPSILGLVGRTNDFRIEGLGFELALAAEESCQQETLCPVHLEFCLEGKEA
jgi:hypothetical protein